LCSASATGRFRHSTPRISPPATAPRAHAAYQIAQVYGGGLIPIIAGRILEAKGVHDGYVYIGGLVMIYAVLAIIAILRTPETKQTDLER
jgi:hypothetical protein